MNNYLHLRFHKANEKICLIGIDLLLQELCVHLLPEAHSAAWKLNSRLCEVSLC